MMDFNHLKYVSSPVREIEMKNTAVFELRKLMALTLNEVISLVPKFQTCIEVLHNCSTQ